MVGQLGEEVRPNADNDTSSAESEEVEERCEALEASADEFAHCRGRK